jgi:hypothetical protein
MPMITHQMIGGLLLSVGAMAGMWGVLWSMWDRGSDSAFLLLIGALLCLLVGSFMTQLS